MIPQKSHIVQTLIGIALVFYAFNNPAEAAEAINKGMQAAATFFGTLG